MRKGFYYLASPYQGSPEQEAHRLEVSLKLTVEFLTQGIYVFSPLVYTNEIIKMLQALPAEKRRQMLMDYLFDFLKVSKGMIIITMEGWKESWGVRQELKFCQENQIPVYRVDPSQASDFSQVLSRPDDFVFSQLN